MKRNYLIYSFTAFLAWMLLQKMDNELKWAALGFGAVMLLIGIFMKEKVKMEQEQEELNNLNNQKEGNKNDI